MNVPGCIKAVGQYIKRAEDAEKDASNPDGVILAFWCRQWAIEKSIPHFAEPEVASFVSTLMDIQEKNKVQVGDKDMGKTVCEGNAMNVFDKADTEDRSGNITKGTAKLFYNAATFLDILDQFDGCKDDKEIEQKRVYAKWKAHDIITALQQGRAPTPGSGVGGPSIDSCSSPSAPQAATPLTVPAATPMPNPVAAPAPAPASTFQSTIAPPSAPVAAGLGNMVSQMVSSIPSIPTGTPSAPASAPPAMQPRGPPKVVDDPRIQDAIELSHFAITNMKYMRIAEAKDKLREALARLERE
jgi:vacuolar protein sorting-associated protein VTA1